MTKLVRGCPFPWATRFASPSTDSRGAVAWVVCGGRRNLHWRLLVDTMTVVGGASHNSSVSGLLFLCEGVVIGINLMLSSRNNIHWWGVHTIRMLAAMSSSPTHRPVNISAFSMSFLQHLLFPSLGGPCCRLFRCCCVPFLRSPPVGECSNFKKNPTHTQDHGDA